MSLEGSVRALLADGSLSLPLPGGGKTAERHRRLAEIAQRDLSVARLAEGHADAVAILAEANREPAPNALYAVWASESSQPLQLRQEADGFHLSGVKSFCSGVGLADRALLTCGPPLPKLIEVDLQLHPQRQQINLSDWATEAFRDTQTGAICFSDKPVAAEDIIAPAGWYLERPGFWHGALGPASCWAGGAIRLVDHACEAVPKDAHARAHLGALLAARWALRSFLNQAGVEIDADPRNQEAARSRALKVRHLVEQTCLDICGRFGRMLGPRPFVFDRALSLHLQQLTIYLRQNHGERDLEGIPTS